MSPKQIKLVNKKTFAEMAGVTAASITHAKKRLANAIINNKINILDPAAQAYIDERPLRDVRFKHQKGKTLPGPHSETVLPASNSTFIAPGIPEELPPPLIPEELANLTLKEIVAQYGGLTEFKIYVAAQDALTSYETKRLKFDEKRGDLIDKKFQASVSFEALELLFARLVNDTPLTLAARVVSIAKRAGDEAIALVKKEYEAANSRALKICKDNLISSLKHKTV